MKTKLQLLLGTATLAVAFAAAVWAQSVVQTDLSGQESWNAGQGPGGPTTGFITSNLVRGGTADVPATPIASISGALTAGVTSLAPLLNGGNLIFPAQPSLATTLTTMANPADGAVLGICNATGSNFATTAIAMGANTGQTMNTTVSTTTLNANTCTKIQYSRATATWYQVQK